MRVCSTCRICAVLVGCDWLSKDLLDSVGNGRGHGPSGRCLNMPSYHMRSPCLLQQLDLKTRASPISGKKRNPHYKIDPTCGDASKALS